MCESHTRSHVVVDFYMSILKHVVSEPLSLRHYDMHLVYLLQTSMMTANWAAALVAVLLALCVTAGRLAMVSFPLPIAWESGAGLRWLPVLICGMSPAVLQQISDPYF